MADHCQLPFIPAACFVMMLTTRDSRGLLPLNLGLRRAF
jgi:hypothetical protein